MGKMTNMFQYTTDEPIYALSSAYVPSALAIIRACGESSHELFAPFFKGHFLESASNSAVHGYVIDEEGNKIDEVVVIKYSKGRGYTSEESFEIMCHGSLPVIKAIESLLSRHGFREALRGEFTYRAFMHGRMDLTEAEAVEELVFAKGERSRVGAIERLSGALKKEADALKKDILNILASLEVYLDYGEDEIIDDWIFPYERVDGIIEKLERISETYKAERLYKEGAKICLAGSVNAGKSSLFNALLKENRAIVSSKAGTTRDYLESECIINGIPVRLFDTAGLRESDDEVEKEGIIRSEKIMDEADLIVYVLDGDEEISQKRDKTIYVHSKKDITHSSAPLSFSSLTGEGIGDVIEKIALYLRRDIKDVRSSVRIESRRQKESIDEAISALKDAEKNAQMSVDIIALYFQSALSALGELTGEVTTDDVLEELFSSFCLGK